MDLVLAWVLLWVVSAGRASCGAAAPQGRSCPAPALCNIVGSWTSLTGSVQVLAWQEGGLLGVKHLSRGLLLEGTARLASNTSRPAFASLVVGSNNIPSLCLQLVLSCFRNTLWVTELPMVGSVPAVLYQMQRHDASPQSRSVPPQPRSVPACSKYSPSSEGTVDIAHNVLVNITLYHNLTTDDVTHSIYHGAAAEDSVGHKKHPKKSSEVDYDQEALEDAAPEDEEKSVTPTKLNDVKDDPEEEALDVTLQQACEDDNRNYKTDVPPFAA